MKCSIIPPAGRADQEGSPDERRKPVANRSHLHDPCYLARVNGESIAPRRDRRGQGRAISRNAPVRQKDLLLRRRRGPDVV